MNMIDNKATQALFRLGKYLVTFMAFYFLATPMHEWAHLTVARLVGANGYIIKYIFGGAMVFTKLPDTELGMFFVSIAGGLTVAAIFGVIYLLDWYSNDLVGSMAVFPIVIGQLIYGIVEGLCFRMSIGEFYVYGSLASIIGYGLGFSISLWIVINYIVKELYKGEKKVTLK